MSRASTKRPSRGPSGADSDYAVGESKLFGAPAARKAPRFPVVAGLVPVPLTAEEEDELSAPAARERQAP